MASPSLLTRPAVAAPTISLLPPEESAVDGLEMAASVSDPSSVSSSPASSSSPSPSPTCTSPAERETAKSAGRSVSSPRIETDVKLDLDSSSRRPSIQFLPTPPSGESERKGRFRMSQSGRTLSPPPPPVFEQRVSFSTFEKETVQSSYTIINTHRHYVHSRTSRRFLCGLDSNDYSEYALQWLFDEMVDDNDEVVCLRVIDKDSSSALSQQDQYQADGQQLMESILSKYADNRAVQLTLELAVGRVQEVFSQMIHLHEPMILVVGTKGRSRAGLQSLLPGSISKFALQCSPVPVVVVNPGLVRDKRKKKRLQDRSRRAYRDLLDKGGSDMPFSLRPREGDSRSSSTATLPTVAGAPTSSGPTSSSRRAAGFLSRSGPGMFSSSGGHSRTQSMLSLRNSLAASFSSTGLSSSGLSTPRHGSAVSVEPGGYRKAQSPGTSSSSNSSSPVTASATGSGPSAPTSAATSVNSTPQRRTKR